ncbi:M20 family metallopeptidase [Anaerovoracaceae bacterium 41-7]|jgi:amidohydrolase|uniref:M20 family metallopeptidase n=1 Tax=Emergencia sp. 1XD21-10 TaxID=2304569 RepID=UPI0013798F13|nr:M20 family metallopeptidase [Emergencia sp. 1XD21-10]MCI9476469.1 M20 family metallopeptidase [Emergencia sp.]NCE99008.1 M20 family peptidase [Emergencia sp. 1XD21-10]
MNYIELKERIFKAIEAYYAELVHLNDDIADHPEVSGEEYETSCKIVELLRSHGYETEYPFSGLPTAFKGIYGANNHKYKIAILTEYDALPEIGHACGHCLSGSISVLAALAAKDLQDELNADIHVIGTPIEETDGAKCAMAERGAFDGYDMAIMVHLYNGNLLAPKLQCLASYLYEFHGTAAHASAAPWEGRNAFNAAQLMFHAVDMLRQHVKPDAQFHGIIRNGGEAPNIVPEKVSAEFYIRALDKKYLQKLIDQVDLCAEGAAIATQTAWCKTPTAATYDNMKANSTGIAALAEIYQELGLELNGDSEKIFGSSDAGNVSYVCPGFHPCLQVTEPNVPIHTRGFAEAMKTDRAHQALRDGAKIIALQIAKIFSDEEKIKAMKEDFDRN